MERPDLPITIRGYEPRDQARIRALTLEGFDGVSIDQNADRRLGLEHGAALVRRASGRG